MMNEDAKFGTDKHMASGQQYYMWTDNVFVRVEFDDWRFRLTYHDVMHIAKLIGQDFQCSRCGLVDEMQYVHFNTTAGVGKWLADSSGVTFSITQQPMTKEELEYSFRLKGAGQVNSFLECLVATAEASARIEAQAARNSFNWMHGRAAA